MQAGVYKVIFDEEDFKSGTEHIGQNDYAPTQVCVCVCVCVCVSASHQFFPRLNYLVHWLHTCELILR